MIATKRSEGCDLCSVFFILIPMLILIAESKTMRDNQRVVSENEYSVHRPYFDDVADRIMRMVSKLSVSEMASLLKCSGKLALKGMDHARDFPLKSAGYTAMSAYNGVVFDSFCYDSLTEVEKEYAERNIMIVSSLYGLLYPDDIIKPYRLDYDSRITDGKEMLSAYWKDMNTEHLIKLLHEREDDTVLNMLPGNAAKCFDWKEIKNHAEVLVADFRIVGGGEGNYKTPHAGLLKKMRGTFLREIVTGRISNGKDLRDCLYDNFLYLGDLRNAGYPAFGGVIEDI